MRFSKSVVTTLTITACLCVLFATRATQNAQTKTASTPLPDLNSSSIIVQSQQGGDTPAASQSSEEKTISFTVTLMDATIDQDLYYLDQDKYVPLGTRPMRRSLPKSVTMGNQFQLFKKTTASAPAQEYQLVGEASIDNCGSKLFFLINKAKKGSTRPLPLRIYVIEDSLTKFPAGTHRFINLTTTPLNINFNQEKNSVLPYKHVTSRPIAKTEGFFPIIITNDVNKTLFSTQIHGDSAAREFVIIEPPANLNDSQLKLTYISEIVRR